MMPGHAAPDSTVAVVTGAARGIGDLIALTLDEPVLAAMTDARGGRRPAMTDAP